MSSKTRVLCLTCRGWHVPTGFGSTDPFPAHVGCLGEAAVQRLPPRAVRPKAPDAGTMLRSAIPHNNPEVGNQRCWRPEPNITDADLFSRYGAPTDIAGAEQH